jgi:hypothetical protein
MHEILTWTIGPVVFASNIDQLYYTSDNGSSWVSADWNTNYEHESLATMGGLLFVGSSGAGVWSRPLSNLNINQVKDIVNRANDISVIPNPSTGVGLISFNLTTSSQVVLEIFDILGREVERVSNKFESEGDHSERFDLSDKPGGTYFITLRTNDGAITKSLSILR